MSKQQEREASVGVSFLLPEEMPYIGILNFLHSLRQQLFKLGSALQQELAKLARFRP